MCLLKRAMDDDPDERLWALQDVFFDWRERPDFNSEVFDIDAAIIKPALPFDTMWKNDPLDDIS